MRSAGGGNLCRNEQGGKEAYIDGYATLRHYFFYGCTYILQCPQPSSCRHLKGLRIAKQQRPEDEDEDEDPFHDGFFVVAAVALIGVMSDAGAADDKWFVLGQSTIKSTDPSVAIKSEGSRFDKDVKQVKISVEGADVQITSVVLHWDNRRTTR